MAINKGGRYADMHEVMDDVVVDTDVENTPSDTLYVDIVALNNTFTDVLSELKKMNIYLAAMTDMQITNDDFGD